MLRITITILLFGISLLLVKGQEIVGSISGIVVDGSTQQPLQGVAVMLSPFNAGTGTETNDNGRFAFNDVEVGLYDVAFLSLTHHDQVVKEVWVRSGKETVLQVELEIRVFELGDKVEVTAVNYMQPRMGTRSFTVEQSLRYAATFFDPARLITSYPGVANVNDQANHFSVRGNNPNANKWLIEGLEVVSPNHLSTAGTPNDYPTLSGGGVNVLSAQMLRRSDFHTGVLPGQYSNATGGIMDMNLRKGNSSETEWTAQAGLIGIDIANEGPISKNSDASYLVNYRYSTLGLLSALGVDLGDERIGFQDLSAHFSIPVSKKLQWSLFGMGGLSTNEFEAVEDPADWEIDKDSSDVDHEATVFIAGTTLNYSLSDRTVLEFGLAYSASDQQRKQGLGLISNTVDRLLLDERGLEDQKLSSRLLLRQRHSDRWDAQYGITMMDRELTTRVQSLRWTGKGRYTRPFMVHEYKVGELITVGTGLGYAIWDLSDDAVVEPSATVEMHISNQDVISVHAGQRAQQPDLQLVFETYEVDSLRSGNNYERLKMTRSVDIVVGYDRTTKSGLAMRIEGFYQTLSRIPGAVGDTAIIASLGTAYSTSLINNWNGLLGGEVKNDRSARMVGAEVSVARSFRNNTFYNGNITVFESTFGGDDGTASNSRWDVGYIANLSGGKEFPKVKEGLTRTWGISGRLNFMGGAKYTPFMVTEQAMVIPGAPFSEQYSQFYRLDLRLYLKKDRAGKTGMWSLDIQNATNAQNGFYDYFDTRKGEVVTEYQLGIIPNLSYRIEF